MLPSQAVYLLHGRLGCRHSGSAPIGDTQGRRASAISEPTTEPHGTEHAPREKEALTVKCAIEILWFLGGGAFYSHY